MQDEALWRALSRALLALRITLGLFLLQWGVEKFVVPQNTPAIWGYFYGLDVPQALAYAFGAAEIVLAACLFLGLFRTAAYGAARGQRRRVLAPAPRSLGRSRQPPVHRRRAGAGRPDRAVPAAALGPRRPGGRRVGRRLGRALEAVTPPPDMSPIGTARSNRGRAGRRIPPI